MTQDELKSLVHYDPLTGLFTRKFHINSLYPVGSVLDGVISRGYQILSLADIKYRAHVMAWLYMYGEIPQEIDHINHDGTDNRIENLRSVTHAENLRNMRMKKNNKSGVTGVHIHSQNGSWTAQISEKRKIFHLGSFNNLFDAVCARRSAEQRLGYHENHGRVVLSAI